jgi:transcriptional regulator with XRE-family HTH domain
MADSLRINGALLRQRRLAQGRLWTQDFVGQRLGISGAAVSQVEGGQCLPSLGVLARMCELYNISMDAALGGTEPFEPASSEEICEIMSHRHSLWNTVQERKLRAVLIRRAGTTLEVWVRREPFEEKKGPQRVRGTQSTNKGDT